MPPLDSTWVAAKTRGTHAALSTRMVKGGLMLGALQAMSTFVP